MYCSVILLQLAELMTGSAQLLNILQGTIAPVRVSTVSVTECHIESAKYIHIREIQSCLVFHLINSSPASTIHVCSTAVFIRCLNLTWNSILNFYNKLCCDNERETSRIVEVNEKI
jgi:hypothetical protein